MNNRQLQRIVLQRFSDQQASDTGVRPRRPQMISQVSSEGNGLLACAGEGQLFPQHLHQFFKMAEHRKRQILEKMLLEQ
jgi:hypothetical protein